MTPEQLSVGIICDLITFVPTLALIWMFKHVRPRQSAYETWVINYHRAFIEAKRRAKQSAENSSVSSKTSLFGIVNSPAPNSHPDSSKKYAVEFAEEEIFHHLARERATGVKVRGATCTKTPPSLEQLRQALVEESDEDSSSDYSE